MSAHERSALAFRRSPARTVSGSFHCIVLPDGLQGHERLTASVRAAGISNTIDMLMPPRGIYSGLHRIDARWFHCVDGQIEAAGFGDALWHLERFVLDRLADTLPSRPLLLGIGGGGLLSMCVAPYLHDRISGLVTLNAHLSLPAWWNPPNVDLQQLPVLVINGQPGSAEWLTARGASVQQVVDIENASEHCTLERHLSPWLDSLAARQPAQQPL
jgi:pimeloyl-ACP methyl ester carboxylesterase